VARYSPCNISKVGDKTTMFVDTEPTSIPRYTSRSPSGAAGASSRASAGGNGGSGSRVARWARRRTTSSRRATRVSSKSRRVMTFDGLACRAAP
jgi:hypothetical protein